MIGNGRIIFPFGQYWGFRENPTWTQLIYGNFALNSLIFATYYATTPITILVSNSIAGFTH